MSFMPYNSVQQQSGGWAKRASARMTRKDGRHPKFENHGRIAGR